MSKEKNYTLGVGGTNYVVETLTGVNYVFGATDVREDFLHATLTFRGTKSWIVFSMRTLVLYAPIPEQ
jgi:hypothetical protein